MLTSALPRTAPAVDPLHRLGEQLERLTTALWEGLLLAALLLVLRRRPGRLAALVRGGAWALAVVVVCAVRPAAGRHAAPVEVVRA